MMWPIYDKFSWEQYQLIGLDEGLQKAFRVIQLAKSTFLIFFLLSAIQFVNLIYFETDNTRIIIFALLAVIMLVAIRLGYLAVELFNQLRNERANLVQVFLGSAVLFTVIIYVIYMLRFMSKLEHHLSGPLNKIGIAVLSKLC